MTQPRYLLWDLDGTLVRWGIRRVIPSVAWRFARGFARDHGWLRTLRALPPAYLALLRSRGGTPLNRVFLERLGRTLAVPEPELEAAAGAVVEEELEYLRHWIRAIPEAQALFEELAATGRYRMVAATNPTMPQRFNELRLGWAGYDVGAFELITGTEVCEALKKRPAFYEGLLERLGAAPEECLMIGNDAAKDLPAALVGIPVFLVTAGDERLGGAPPGAEPVATGDFQALAAYLAAQEDER